MAPLQICLSIFCLTLLIVSTPLPVSADINDYTIRFGGRQDTLRRDKPLRNSENPVRNSQRNDRPIIGIFTQPSGTTVDGTVFAEYIAGSYVKYIESAGARVVPVRYQRSKEELKILFSRLNGVLLPGGGTELIPGDAYYEAGVALWEYVQTDPTFPIFGTCLGFELLSSLASGSDTVLRKSGHFSADNISWPVNLTREAEKSVMFKGLDRKVIKALQTEPIAYNSHSDGITPDVFYRTPNLAQNFNILGTGRDKNQKEFVAIIEAKERPMWGVQFHPEKAVFEWYLPVNIPHQPEAIALAQHLADLLVQHARMNMNRFPGTPSEVAKKLINNYRYAFLGNEYFQEMWLFHPSDM